MFSKAEEELFLLAVLLIVVAYFVGFSTDANVLLAGMRNLLYVAQGRNPATGQFASYPGGASAAPTISAL